jgi:DNA-binding NarL/FixJ family response regulator
MLGKLHYDGRRSVYRLSVHASTNRGANDIERRASPLKNLTPRQREIAGLLSSTGLSYKEVAARLNISLGTMRKHAENVYRKKGVHSRAELTVVLLGKTE